MVYVPQAVRPTAPVQTQAPRSSGATVPTQPPVVPATPTAQTSAVDQSAPLPETGRAIPFLDLFDAPLPTEIKLDPSLAQASTPTETPKATDDLEPDAPKPTVVDLSVSEPEKKAHQGPGLEQIIKEKKVLNPGEDCPEMPKLLKMLANAGYKVQHQGNKLEGESLRALRTFQQDHGIADKDSPFSGKLGPQTMLALQDSQKWQNMDKNQCNANAEAAKDRIKTWKSGGQCFHEAALSIDQAYGSKQNWLQGGEARMASDSFRGPNSRFTEVQIKNKADFAKLPDGAVIVYKPIGNHTAGHIDIVATNEDGRRIAISDFRRDLTINLWRDQTDDSVWNNGKNGEKGFEIFVPKR